MATKQAKNTKKATNQSKISPKSDQETEGCKGASLFAILIIVLVWVSDNLWSKILITLAAAFLFLTKASKMVCNSRANRKK